MKKFSFPEIDFLLTKLAFNNFRDQYNEDQDNLRDKLRDTHAELYYDLVRQYILQIKKHVSLFADTPQLRTISTDNLPSLRSNRKISSLRQHNINGTTVYRRLERLIKAGVFIGKVGHGKIRDYELFFNPELVIFRDKTNPRAISESKFLKNALNQGSQNGKNASFTAIHYKIQSNNKIIPVDKVSNDKETNSSEKDTIPAASMASGLPDNLKHKSLTQEPHRISEISGVSANIPVLQDEKNSNSGEKNTKNQTYGTLSGEFRPKNYNLKSERMEKIHNHRVFLAREFVFYMISLLFNDKSLFPGVVEKTIDYALSFYFSENMVKSYKAGNQLLAEYKWRLQKAKDYIDRYQFDMSYIFPLEYIQVSNSGSGKMSFANTAKWLEDTRNYLRIKHKKKQARHKLDALKQYLIKEPTIHMYKKCETYVESNIPAVMHEFQVFAKSIFSKMIDNG